MKKLVLLLMISTILFSCTQNQLEPFIPGMIMGKVIDAKTQQPISGVIISTDPITSTKLNNSDGSFSINDLEEGTYTVSASKYGYKTNEVKVKILSGIISEVVVPLVISTVENNPPTVPILIYPQNNAVLTDKNITLKWNSTDIDNETLKYKVYFSNQNPPQTAIAENITSKEFILNNLEPNTKYYWKVVVSDSYTNVESEIFSFTLKSPDLPDNNNLVLHYTFDKNNANDESGNGNNGTLKNNPSFVSGKFGNACKLSGTNDRLGTGSHILLPYINFKNFPNFTIAIWVKEQNLDFYNGEAYINWGNASTGWIGISTFAKPPQQTNAIYNFSVGCEFGDSYGRQKPVFAEYNSNEAKNWKHLVLVYSNGIVKAYIDGSLVGTTTNTIVNIENYGAIGKHWWNYGGTHSSTSLSFTIDDVRVYKIALSEVQISQLADQ